MVLTCLLGSTIVNKIGYKWALVLGAAGYAPYAGGLVLNLNTGATWLVFVGSVTCGLSAGLVRDAPSLSFSSASTDSLNAGSFGPSKEPSSWVVRFLPLSSSSLPVTDPTPFQQTLRLTSVVVTSRIGSASGMLAKFSAASSLSPSTRRGAPPDPSVAAITTSS
jgi:hypothetical protein